MKTYWLTVLISFLFIPLQGQEFKTKSISVFKNGMVFFHKGAEVNASSGQVKLTDLPIANAPDEPVSNSYYGVASRSSAIPVLFGSVWFNAEGNQLLQTAVFEEEVSEKQVINDPIQLIHENVNNKLIFRLKDDPVTREGKILAVNGTAVFLKMEAGWKQVLVSQIDYFDFEEEPLLSSTIKKQKKVVRLDFRKPASRQSLDLMYMQRRISWLPNYFLTIQGNNKAKLSLEANLINDIEDLNEVDINFVLGIPSFQFSQMEDPLFSAQRLVDFLAGLNSGSQDRAFLTNAITSQRAAVNRDFNPADFPDDLEGLEQEDLFFYKKSKITLPKGGRMLVHLLETEIEYEDVYSVQLSKGFSGINRDESFRNKVWHSLKFKNDSGFPLTTGSIFFMKASAGKSSPISQNQLDFVPNGQYAKVKMTQVPDISVVDSEKEIKRLENVRDKYWDLVTVEGTVEISNFKNHAVILEVEREITGALLKTDHPWESFPITRNLNAQNQINYVNWTFELKPGEKKKIIYQYEIYVD